MGKEPLNNEQLEKKQREFQELIEFAENTNYLDQVKIYGKYSNKDLVLDLPDFSETPKGSKLLNQEITFFVDPRIFAAEDTGKRIKPEDATYYRTQHAPEPGNPEKMKVVPISFEELIDSITTYYIPPKPEKPERSRWGKFRDLFNFMLGKSKSRLQYEEDVKDYPLKLQRREEVIEAGKYRALMDSAPFRHYDDVEFERPEISDYSKDELDEYVKTGKAPEKAGEDVKADVKAPKKAATVGDLKRKAIDQVLDACVEATADKEVAEGCSTIKEYFKDDNNFNTYEGKHIYGFLLNGKTYLNDPNGLNEFKQKLNNVCRHVDDVLAAGNTANKVLEKLQNGKYVAKDDVEDIHKNGQVNVK